MQTFFGLSRANYLTVPRSILEDMPVAWQDEFAKMLDQIDRRYRWPDGMAIEVRLRDPRGNYAHDPLADYRHVDPLALEAVRLPSPRRGRGKP